MVLMSDVREDVGVLLGADSRSLHAQFWRDVGGDGLASDARPVSTDNVTSVRIQLANGDGGLAVD